MKGLIIKTPWIEKILSGEKTWEIRGSHTKVRERVELIKSGTGLIYGSVQVVDSLQIMWHLYNQEEWDRHKDKHQVPFDWVKYSSPHVWVLRNPIVYGVPRPYKHPQGAVIWVNLGESEIE